MERVRSFGIAIIALVISAGIAFAARPAAPGTRPFVR